MKVLILGATGLLGHQLLASLRNAEGWQVEGAVRSETAVALFVEDLRPSLRVAGDLTDPAALAVLIDASAPDVVVNCISVPKAAMVEWAPALAVYATLSRNLQQICHRHGVRMIHVSSDGVFSGRRGSYAESDLPDAEDVYGVAKRLGEVGEDSPGVSLRCSVVGHELRGREGMVEWLLGVSGQCRGFDRSIFTGMPAPVLADAIRDHVLARPALSGIYHVAAAPISKYALLRLIAARYGLEIEIVADDTVVVDRSLAGDRFREATGFVAPSWPDMIDQMFTRR